MKGKHCSRLSVQAGPPNEAGCDSAHLRGLGRQLEAHEDGLAAGDNALELLLRAASGVQNDQRVLCLLKLDHCRRVFQVHVGLQMVGGDPLQTTHPGLEREVL